MDTRNLNKSQIQSMFPRLNASYAVKQTGLINKSQEPSALPKLDKVDYTKVKQTILSENRILKSKENIDREKQERKTKVSREDEAITIKLQNRQEQWLKNQNIENKLIENYNKGLEEKRAKEFITRNEELKKTKEKYKKGEERKKANKQKEENNLMYVTMRCTVEEFNEIIKSKIALR